MLTILKKLVLSTLVAGGLAFAGSTPARADTNYAAEITPAHFSITFGHRDYDDDDYAYQPYYAAPAYPAYPSYGNYYQQPTYVQPYYAPRYSRPSYGFGYQGGYGGYSGGWGGNGWHNGWRRY